MKTDFNLRDYLMPGGKRPYASLPGDLEAALARGENVYLWSVAGHFMLSGAPELVKYGRAWSDGTKWYKTAKDCIDRKNGKRG